MKRKAHSGNFEMWSDNEHGRALVLVSNGNYVITRVTVILFEVCGADAEKRAQAVFSALVRAIRETTKGA